MPRSIIPLLLATLAVTARLAGQNTAVILEAEAAARGGDVTTGTDGAIQYVTAATNAAGQNPGGSARVLTFSVTFPAAATYELYARIRVGPAGFDDDSLFYGNGFGTKTPASDADWILANSLSGMGHTAAGDIVTGAGTASNNVWKWIKLSEFEGGETPVQFAVTAGALTQTFQVGMREDGLQIDKIAFGPDGVDFTVTNLDNNQAGTPAPSSGPFTPTGPPLANGKTKWLGSAYNPGSGQSANFDKYWNQVVPENAGKWGSVEGTRDVMNWTALDEAYDFAKTNGFPFRLHVLIWGNQQPSWIESLPAAEQLQEIEEWFAAVAARYPDLDIVEVVNEPLHDPPNQPGSGGGNYMNALGGSGTTGWDWVINAFRLGRLHFPQARLMLNEYSVTNSAGAAASYVQIIQLLKNEGLIDVVGIQAHAFETRDASADTTRSNLNTIAAAGLPIYLTEMDIDGLTDQVQLAEYQRVFPVFWEHPAVKGITLWGYRPGLWRNAQGAFITQADGTERSAMQWLASYVRDTTPPDTALPASQRVAVGNTAVFAAPVSGAAPFSYQWRKNGVDLAGETSASLSVANVQPADAGVYSVAVTNAAGTTVSPGAVLGPETSAKIAGTGTQVLFDVVHPNGNVYDQVLITGAAVTLTADPGQVLRASYVDLSDDIVQIEFSGAGSLTITLDNPTGPAAPVNYNQTTQYMKGHATLTLAGADGTTNISAFTVGTNTAVNQALFKPEVNYDGVADLALLNIVSTNGQFGGIRCANTEFFAASGLTGVNAPGVNVVAVANIHNISASDQATPVLLTGTIGAGRVGITGGDMFQANGRAIQVGDAQSVHMLDGETSHKKPQPAQQNRGVYERNGVNVTTTLVVNP